VGQLVRVAARRRKGGFLEDRGRRRGRGFIGAARAPFRFSFTGGIGLGRRRGAPPPPIGAGRGAGRSEGRVDPAYGRGGSAR
jgi:hypothetical protein